MKVLVITGSAHKNGTSAYLAERFIQGAEEAGHEVYRFDAAFKDIHPCIACEKCHTDASVCTFKDDMNELNPHLIEADVVVLVSPIYYFDINAQLKVVIDRFYANDSLLHGDKKAVLMVTMADKSGATASGAIESFKGMTKYLDWEVKGSIIALNCMTLDMLKNTRYPNSAYELGKSL
ncbi:MAG: flavodoxin family protein [Ruminococcus sp.]|nr:flavodoxin family protein [Ruminococcus sp.]